MARWILVDFDFAGDRGAPRGRVPGVCFVLFAGSDRGVAARETVEALRACGNKAAYVEVPGGNADAVLRRIVFDVARLADLRQRDTFEVVADRRRVGRLGRVLRGSGGPGGGQLDLSEMVSGRWPGSAAGRSRARPTAACRRYRPETGCPGARRREGPAVRAGTGSGGCGKACGAARWP